MLEIGSVIDGKYKILNQIGQGGMSTVYLAMNERANRQWAIKEVRREGLWNDQIVRQSLMMEISLLRKLKHQYLPRIVDVIDRDGSFLIVMDYIEGRPLSDLLKDNRPLPQNQVIHYAKQLCEVLSYLHSWKPAIIYRDLKPGNIMLQPDENIKLIDFGAAREYRNDMHADTRCLGTKGYAAPEQFGGAGQTDQRTDIYCLGTTLYHLLTGHNPCLPPYEIYPIRHWNESLSEGLEKIIQKCTENDPKKRYRSCAEIRYDLEHLEMLEVAYKQKQCIRLAVFGCSVIITSFLIIRTISLYKEENKLTTENYYHYMEEARSGANKEVQTENYLKAIQLEPGNAKAYLAYIDQLILEDDILTVIESEKIRELMIQKAVSGKTYEETLKEDSKGYEELAYRLGLAYFYTYEEEGNKALSAKWLDIAAEGTMLEEKQQIRAERLGKIAKYYAKLGKVDKAGDLEISYAEYWHDLCQVTSGNIVKEDNQTTARMVYREMIYQIYVHTEAFCEAGIQEEDLMKQLDGMAEVIEEYFIEDEIDLQGREKKQLLLDIQKAGKVVENTYQKEN